jgi:amphi-Trp domain-containing protein
MGKGKIKSKHTMTRENLAAYLENLLTGLRQGTLILDDEERPMVLRPSDPIEVEVEIKQKSDKEKVELKLTWVPNRMQPLTTVAALTEAPLLPADPMGDEAKKK